MELEASDAALPIPAATARIGDTGNRACRAGVWRSRDGHDPGQAHGAIVPGSGFGKAEPSRRRRRFTARLTRHVGAIRWISSDISIEQSTLHHLKPYK